MRKPSWKRIKWNGRPIIVAYPPTLRKLDYEYDIAELPDDSATGRPDVESYICEHDINKLWFKNILSHGLTFEILGESLDGHSLLPSAMWTNKKGECYDDKAIIEHDGKTISVRIKVRKPDLCELDELRRHEILYTHAKAKKAFLAKPSTELAFIIKDDFVRILFNGTEWHMKCDAGARYLNELLHNPDKVFRSKELINRLSGNARGSKTLHEEKDTQTNENKESASDSGNSDPSIEKTARKYAKQLQNYINERAHLEKEQQDSGKDNSILVGTLDNNIEALRKEVGKYYNKYGKLRRKSLEDNKGPSIRRAIDRFLKRLIKYPPKRKAADMLKTHIRKYISYGASCTYNQVYDLNWK
ncbi:MAG: hypothetical protein A2283_17815 [Lentisphaerae bacterium RIFOXYA12_FULL_48_11]|nr:MAG: hypothetical protein A2283_17815 [Lentisphaerae bacterium RIFOXYA12_FULL_48_11]